MPGELSGLTQAQEAAVQTALARGEGARSAHLVIDDDRVALEIVAADEPRLGLAPARPRLRFDRVALRLLSEIRTAVRGDVPEGQALLLTVTAPIRLASKTAAALEERVRSWLGTGGSPAEVSVTLFGNAVRVRLVRGRRGSSEVAGFVHNPESDAVAILDAAQAFLETLAKAAGRGQRADVSSVAWLVIAAPQALPIVELYRSLCSQISVSDDFGKVLLALGDRRLELLAG